MQHVARVAVWMILAAIVGAASAPAATAPATQPAATQPLAGESHQIENLAQGDLLRPRDASSKEGAPLVLYPHQAWRCMTWKFDPAAGDAVRLVNYFTHKTLHPSGAADRAAVTQQTAGKDATDEQRWRFIPLGDDGTFRIEHVPTGRVLSVTADGDVIVEKWTGAATQKWKLLDKPAKFTG